MDPNGGTQAAPEPGGSWPAPLDMYRETFRGAQHHEQADSHIHRFDNLGRMLLRAAARLSARHPLPIVRLAASQPQLHRNYAKDDKPRRAVPKSPSHLRAAEASQRHTPNGPVQNQTWSPDRPIRFAAPAEQAQATGRTTILDKEAVPGGHTTSETQFPAPESAQQPIITPPPPIDAVEFRENPTTATSSVQSKSEQPAQQPSTQEPIILSTPPANDDSVKESPGTASPGVGETTTQRSIITPPPPTDDAKIREPVRLSKSDTLSEPTASSSAQSEAPAFDAQSKLGQQAIDGQEAPAQAEAQPGPTGPLPDLRHGIPSSFDSEFPDRSSIKTKDTESPSLDITEDPARSGAGGRRRRDNDEDYYTSIDRRRFALARWLYAIFGGVAIGGAAWFGRNWSDEEVRLYPDAPNGWNPKSFYARIKQRMAPTLGYYTEPTFPKLLPDVDPMMRPSPYTLILSLEDLLVSSSWDRKQGWKVAKRPGVDYFIRYMSQYYELAIFTSVQSMNAEVVIRKLDPYRLIAWPLYREGTRYMNGEYVKVLFSRSGLDQILDSHWLTLTTGPLLPKPRPLQSPHHRHCPRPRPTPTRKRHSPAQVEWLVNRPAYD